jgi:hypothetical protein
MIRWAVCLALKRTQAAQRGGFFFFDSRPIARGLMMTMTASLNQACRLVHNVAQPDAGVDQLSELLIALLIVVVIIVLLLSQEDPEVGMAP